MMSNASGEVRFVEEGASEGRQFFFLRTACACSCDHCCCDKSELCYWLQALELLNSIGFIRLTSHSKSRQNFLFIQWCSLLSSHKQLLLMLIAILLAIVLIVLQQLGMGGKRKKRAAATVQGLFKHL